MKKTRRFAAIAAAAMMTACMAVPMMAVMPASAASGDNSITIQNYNPDNAGLSHSSFAAYQVFAGNYDTVNNNLTVTGWGDGINVDAFLAAIKADATLRSKFAVADGESDPYVNSVAGAVAVSDVVGTWTSDSAEAKAFAKLAVANKTTSSGTYENGVISGIADGYYVIADTAAATDTDGNSAWSLGMLQVAGGTNVSVTTKIDYPTVVKKVQEDDVNTDGDYGAGYNDVADWDINTDVPFKIIATMPSNIDEYEHYYMKFTDTMADNFGTPENVVVTVGATTLSDAQYATTFTGNDMTIEIKDLKNLTDSESNKITITADTKVTVAYTAKLNNNGDTPAVIGLPGQENKVKLEYSNNPNVTGNGTGTPGDENTGKTPEDTVIVFTYELDITKIDGATGEKLSGAEFLLANSDGKYAQVNDSGYFVAWVDKANATTLTSDANGLFKVIGLDDGIYYLHEQSWSEEYNIPSTPFTVVIDAATAYTQVYMENEDTNEPGEVLTALSGTIAGEDAGVNRGIVTGTIENNKGTTLPSTGGIGTTIFYVVGGVLVAGAGVTLIAKKRMKNEK